MRAPVEHRELPALLAAGPRTDALDVKLERGSVVSVRLGAGPRAGDLVLLRRPAGATLRRALAVSAAALYVHGVPAPRPDGWVSRALLVGVVTRAPYALRLPVGLAWPAALALARARARVARARSVGRNHTGAHLEVTLAQPADLDALQALREPVGLPRMQPVASPHGAPFALVARVDERVVGGMFATWSAAGVLYGYALWVARGARGAGAGEALKRAFLLEGRARGARAAVCHVHARNVANLRLNAKLGWRRTGGWLHVPDDPLGAMDLQLVELRRELA